ncbi:opioid growth factor receptor-related protein [Marinobacter zhanjiangensis]|uniref:Opioid growth factor receptor (OGFr) conserved domain-containing protein n=1 Tax=Marinobacter zhanjiangensis TaxID=578215 RepID=A0ABQ3ASK7_9GAMM|nr:opioid growth factor receptor-related protein [Marinobacter zhanjiangensis]GGY63266.1 hypothetical protein GCM10007071_07290 [Marinobacter zhanjiangensis]
MPDQNPLIAFTLGTGTDHKGRTIEDILALDDFWLEHTHDYIQWLFPIPEAGRFNGFAPVLDQTVRERFANDPVMQAQQRRALDRMLRFLGLVRQETTIEAGPELNPRDHIWLKRGGHNHLRLTRMIRSLHCCHQHDLAEGLKTAIIGLARTRGYVRDETLEYWLRATD